MSYNGHIPGTTAKWAIHIEVQIKSPIFKRLDAISALAFHHNVRKACETNKFQEGTVLWPSVHFRNEQAKPVLAYLMSATEENNAC